MVDNAPGLLEACVALEEALDEALDILTVFIKHLESILAQLLSSQPLNA